ncbi:methyltransferase domain-containing protein [Streptomyces sp. NPDC058701]|uniref:methyltransferase domain-containing protein n=1 Tax=Streptomyces sp. NPDC058701 TaxID=3346608 RepID=UPI00365D3E6A
MRGRQSARRCGHRQGLKVLDIGSGAGNFSFLLADAVGGQGGSVAGVGHDPVVIASARAEARRQGRENAQFAHADLRSAFHDCDYDAVADRWSWLTCHGPTACCAA